MSSYTEDSFLADRSLGMSIYSQLTERSMSLSQFASSSSHNLPAASASSFSSGGLSGHITCSTTTEFYTIVGSSLGCLWILDRRSLYVFAFSLLFVSIDHEPLCLLLYKFRNGKTVSATVAHYDCAIVNIYCIGNYRYFRTNCNTFVSCKTSWDLYPRIITVSEKSSCVWSFEENAISKVCEVKGSFDNLSMNTTMLCSYDKSSRSNRCSDSVVSLSENHMNYTLHTFSGHKMYYFVMHFANCFSY